MKHNFFKIVNNFLDSADKCIITSEKIYLFIDILKYRIWYHVIIYVFLVMKIMNYLLFLIIYNFLYNLIINIQNIII